MLPRASYSVQYSLHEDIQDRQMKSSGIDNRTSTATGSDTWNRDDFIG